MQDKTESALLKNDNNFRRFQPLHAICFRGEDRSCHNCGHINMQLMRRFARTGMALYASSIVIQKLVLGQGTVFVQKLLQEIKGMFVRLKKSDAGFWVYSPFLLPVPHVIESDIFNVEIIGTSFSSDY